jgi:beta-phosphoglucomutase-like phosphatase (HAD superfamily)
MPRSESKRINRDQYDAVLFDLDGVITNTATLHATCWKQMFDEYLRKRAEQKGEAFRPFDLATDYQLYVDGKPRFDGVRDFLRSRRIQLPEGNPDDPADVETVHGLGNRKNDLVNRAIAEMGVEPYAGTVQFIHQLRRDGFKMSSRTPFLESRLALMGASGL